MKQIHIAFLLIFLSFEISNAKIITFDSEQEFKRIETNIDRYYKNSKPDYIREIQNGWHGFYFKGKKVGWTHIIVEKITKNSQTYYLTRTSTMMTRKKFGTREKLFSKSESLEDSQGNILLFFSYKRKDKAVVIIQGKQEKNIISWTINKESEIIRKQRKVKRKLVGPYKVEQLINKNLNKPGFTKKVFGFSGNDPEKDIAQSITIKKAEIVDILGEKKKLIKVQVIMDMGMPVSTILWITPKGLVYKMSVMDLMYSYRLPKARVLKDDRIPDMTTILE